jgi:hypothetical protein
VWFRRFGGTYRLRHHGDKNPRARNNVSSNWQPKHAAAYVVPSWPILVANFYYSVALNYVNVRFQDGTVNISLVTSYRCKLNQNVLFFHLLSAGTAKCRKGGLAGQTHHSYSKMSICDNVYISM